jgi:uncharacterized protein YaiI (UPF0178 family)
VALIVDGNNVMGTTPDGWWRDRPAAVRRLLARLQCHAALTGKQIVLVLDVPQDDLPEGEHGGVTVHYPSRRGRNAADDRILELLQAGDRVVTADQDLAAQAASAHAELIGPKTLLAQLDDGGC